MLRSEASGLTAYRLELYGPRTYYIRKIIDGTVTTLGTAISAESWNIYVQTRFRVDGFQLSVEEYKDGDWVLIAVVEDTSEAILAGYAGLFGSSLNTAYHIMFDNVEISEKQV